MKMTETARKQYEAVIETNRIRFDLEMGADDSDEFQEVFEKFTDIEKGVFVLLEYQCTPKWIINHFEFSRQRYYQIVGNIKKKIIQYMEENKNENL